MSAGEMARPLKAMQAEKQVLGAVEVDVGPCFFEPLLELVIRLQRRGSTSRRRHGVA